MAVLSKRYIRLPWICRRASQSTQTRTAIACRTWLAPCVCRAEPSVGNGNRGFALALNTRQTMPAESAISAPAIFWDIVDETSTTDALGLARTCSEYSTAATVYSNSFDTESNKFAWDGLAAQTIFPITDMPRSITALSHSTNGQLPIPAPIPTRVLLQRSKIRVWVALLVRTWVVEFGMTGNSNRSDSNKHRHTNKNSHGANSPLSKRSPFSTAYLFCSALARWLMKHKGWGCSYK